MRVGGLWYCEGIKKVGNMFGIITRSDGLELAVCEPCGNYTPVHYLDGDVVCKYCYDSNPELY